MTVKQLTIHKQFPHDIIRLKIYRHYFMQWNLFYGKQEIHSTVLNVIPSKR